MEPTSPTLNPANPTVYEISATSTINAPPERVWAVLDDFAGWTRWMPSMEQMQVELLSAGAPRRGYRFRLRGGVVYADLEVTGYSDLERVTEFAVHVPVLPPLRGQNSCRMHPLSNGRYRIERVDRIYLNNALLIRFLDATQRKRFERLAVEFVQALKRAVA